jgi:hypothetical protein
VKEYLQMETYALLEKLIQERWFPLEKYLRLGQITRDRIRREKWK